MNVFTPAQNKFRFYEDGAEDTSSPIAAENTNITRVLTGDSNLQLRILIQETGGGTSGATTDDWQLQYSLNGSASWVSITTSTAVIKGFNSASLTDAATTTNRATNGITDGTGSFVAGEVSETGLITDRQLTLSNFTEMLYSLTIVANDVVDADTIDFRMLYNGATFTYNVTPRITISEAVTRTKTFTGDGIMLVQANPKTYTADGIVQVQANPKTYTADGIIKTIDNPKTFTADGIIFATNPKTFTADGVVLVQNNPLTFTADGLVAVPVPKTFTVDGIVQVQNIPSAFTADGIVKVLDNPKTFTLDGIVQVQNNPNTFTADGIIKTLDNPASFTADGIIKVLNIPNTFTVDGIIKTLDVPATFTVDGVIIEAGVSTKTYTADGIIKVLGAPATFTADGVIIAAGVNTKTYTADGIIKVVDTPNTFTLDGIVVTGALSKSFTIDGIIFGYNSITFDIDGIVMRRTARGAISPLEETHFFDEEQVNKPLVNDLLVGLGLE